MAKGLWTLAVLTFSLLAAWVEGRDDTYPGPNGRMDFSDGSQCAWFEMRQSVTTTNLAMGCTCKDERGMTQAYTCQYEGEPDKCPNWKEDPQLFLDELVDQIAGKY